MEVFRVQKAKYEDPLSLDGARLAPARRHHTHQPIVYTAESRALAMHEIEVHHGHSVLLLKWLLWTIQVDDAAIREAKDFGPLAQDWISRRHLNETRDYGSRWAKSEFSAGLIVSSAVVPDERNLLINMRHPEAPNAISVVGSKALNFDGRKWTEYN